jgi:hypothetical protein
MLQSPTCLANAAAHVSMTSSSSSSSASGAAVYTAMANCSDDSIGGGSCGARSSAGERPSDSNTAAGCPLSGAAQQGQRQGSDPTMALPTEAGGHGSGQQQEVAGSRRVAGCAAPLGLPASTPTPPPPASAAGLQSHHLRLESPAPRHPPQRAAHAAHSSQESLPQARSGEPAKQQEQSRYVHVCTHAGHCLLACSRGLFFFWRGCLNANSSFFEFLALRMREA